MSQPQGSQEGQGSQGMVVDEESRKRQLAEEDNFQEVRGQGEEEETPVPTEVPGPRRQLSLGDLWDLMQHGMAQNQSNFDRMGRNVAAVQNEAREAKEMAARATTIACETKSQIGGLEKRIAQLESGSPAGGGGGGRSSGYRDQPDQSQSKRDWEQLGGEEGNVVALGGFREYASKEERRDEWSKLQPQIPEELRERVQETIVPNAPCSTILLKLEKAANATDTRRAMLDWVKKFRGAQVKTQTDGESTERVFWAGPSKPFAMRQRDAKLTHTFEGLKLMIGEEGAGKMHIDRANGRIFHDRTLLAQRDQTTGTPIPKTAALENLIPGFTEEGLKAKIEESKATREASRRPP